MNDVPHLDRQRGLRQRDEARGGQPPDHLVTFYESSEFLAASARRFLLEGLLGGETVVVVATPTHRDAFAAVLEEAGHDLTRSRREGRYVELDAASTLEDLIVGGRVDPDRFDRIVSRVVAGLALGGGVRVFGEMVALLWDEGEHDLALTLEDHWNELIERGPFPLLCGYPLAAFDTPETTARFHDVCGRHSRVTTDSYATLDETGIAVDGVVLLAAREPGGRRS